MASSIANVKVGVCSINYNGTDLGHTQGGVEVMYEPEYHEIKVDKYGNTVVDRVLIGEKLTAKVPLAEYQMDRLKVALPHSVLTGTTTQKLTVGSVAGKRQSAIAAALILHPLANAAGDKSEDIKFLKAAVTESVTINEKVDDDKILEVTFTAYPDETATDGAMLAVFGDPSAT